MSTRPNQMNFPLHIQADHKEELIRGLRGVVRRGLLKTPWHRMSLSEMKSCFNQFLNGRKPPVEWQGQKFTVLYFINRFCPFAQVKFIKGQQAEISLKPEAASHIKKGREQFCGWVQSAFHQKREMVDFAFLIHAVPNPSTTGLLEVIFDYADAGGLRAAVRELMPGYAKLLETQPSKTQPPIQFNLKFAA